MAGEMNPSYETGENTPPTAPEFYQGYTLYACCCRRGYGWGFWLRCLPREALWQFSLRCMHAFSDRLCRWDLPDRGPVWGP